VYSRSATTWKPTWSLVRSTAMGLLRASGTARDLLVGDAEAREEQYMAGGTYTGPLALINVPKLHTL
jgi:hypothetical protein